MRLEKAKSELVALDRGGSRKQTMILVGVVLVGALIFGELVSYATTQNRLWNERLQAEKIAVVKAEAEEATRAEAERIEIEAEEATKAAVEAEADNGLEMSFVYCPAGSFTMGSPSRETKRQDDEEWKIVIDSFSLNPPPM